MSANIRRQLSAEKAKNRKLSIQNKKLKDKNRELDSQLTGYSKLLNTIYDYVATQSSQSDKAIRDGGLSPAIYGENKGMNIVSSNVAKIIVKSLTYEKKSDKAKRIWNFMKVTYYTVKAWM